jgi:hypothetical protein
MAEGAKLRGSAHARVAWALPLVFILVDFFLFHFKALGIKIITDDSQRLIDTIQIKTAGALWGGYFYPMFIAVLPAMLFQLEHRNKTWRHLGAMPTPPACLYLAKAAWAAILSLGALALTWLLLWAESRASSFAAPHLPFKFHGFILAAVLGWLWLGSLPVMSIYIWVSNRINSVAVPMFLATVGIMLTTMLTSQPLNEPWKRDFIPWATPTVCVLQVLSSAGADKKDVDAAGLFVEEPNVLRLPSGKKVAYWQNIPDDEIWPPPPPTPQWTLALFCAMSSLAFLLLGALDAGRARK